MTTSGGDARFAIDADSVAGYREQLKAMTHGVPVAEAAVDGFSDWQVVEVMERMWAVAVGADEDDSPEGGAANQLTPTFERPT
jgi:predicted membrane GTPase involved in stress response